REAGGVSPGTSGLEGMAAAAGPLRVRVLDREARPVQAIEVVDLDPTEVRGAHGVDVELDPTRLDHLVPLLLRFLPAELVGESGAAASHDAETQPPVGLPLLEAQILDLPGGRLRALQHAALLWALRRLCGFYHTAPLRAPTTDRAPPSNR